MDIQIATIILLLSLGLVWFNVRSFKEKGIWTALWVINTGLCFSLYFCFKELSELQTDFEKIFTKIYYFFFLFAGLSMILSLLLIFTSSKRK